jgi:hypothetical protein
MASYWRMERWSAFYAVTAGASATLLGLLFVAVSINVEIILGAGRENTRRLAEQAFQSYFAVILVSLVALFPGIGVNEFGVAVLCMTTASAGWLLVRLFKTLTKFTHEDRVQSLRRYLSSLIGFGLLLISAARLSLHRGDSLNLLAISTIVLLSSATLVSWELLLRLSRGKLAEPSG